jgi:hypothetical protein
MEQAVKLLTKLKIIWKRSSVSVAAVGCFIFYFLHEAGPTHMQSWNRTVKSLLVDKRTWAASNGVGIDPTVLDTCS